MNWLIIFAIIVLFIVQYLTVFVEVADATTSQPHPSQDNPQPFHIQKSKINDYVLDGWTIKGLFGHMWLHGGIIHLLGNLFVLWVFGNAVCAKLGNLLYLPAYIIFGLLAATCHIISTDGRAIGASGAIFGVIGMYLVFFTLNNVDCLFIFWFPLFIKPYIKPFCISGFWIILLWVIKNIWGILKGTGHVGYMAHLGGFFSGFLIAIVLLMTKLIQMEKYERSLLQIWDERKQIPEAEPDRRFGIYSTMLEDSEAAEKTQPQETIRISDDAKQQDEPAKMPQAADMLKEVPIHFACSCGKRFKVPGGFAGRGANCPKCNKRLIIPPESTC
jgi:membrane associated rhomboid family serine protease